MLDKSTCFSEYEKNLFIKKPQLFDSYFGTSYGINAISKNMVVVTYYLLEGCTTYSYK